MQKNNTSSAASAYADFTSASGPVSIRMNNDYLFRALLQRNNRVLKGLICSLLHLDSAQVRSVSIANPIELGDAIFSKDFLLDIKVQLNDRIIINLEMQVINEHNWPERSLSYLCRSFDNLEQAQNYIDVQPCIQIGLLDFTLFPEYPEFFATYQFLNTKNHTLYSDKLRLCVIDLTKISMATEEDKAYHIDYWASLFKAATWEEIKMLAQKDEYIRDASNTIYHLSQEAKIRMQCEAREDYYRRQGDLQLRQERSEAAIAEKDSIIAEQESIIAEKDAALAEKDLAIAEKDSALAEKDSAIAEKDLAIAEKNSALAALQAEIERLKYYYNDTHHS